MGIRFFSRFATLVAAVDVPQELLLPLQLQVRVADGAHEEHQADGGGQHYLIRVVCRQVRLYLLAPPRHILAAWLWAHEVVEAGKGKVWVGFEG